MTDTVSFQQDTRRITLYLSKLSGLPFKNIRKLFSMMLSEPWNNEAAISTTDQFLKDIVVDSKAEWADASRRYQNEWRLIEKPARRRTRAEISATAAIKSHNDELSRALKKAKTQHERWVNIQAIWNDTKHKMN